MTCPECGKVIAFTKPLKATDDAVTCMYCHQVIPAESIVWSDGKFHFDILGDVTLIKIAPRVLMKNQTTTVLDLRKLLAQATSIIFKEPNLQCICSEFFIQDSDIRIEVLTEQ